MRLFISLFLSLLLCGHALATSFNANDTSNATFTGVAAVTAKYINIDRLEINVGTDGPDTITLKCGDNTKLGPYYFAANSGLAIITLAFSRQPLVRCGAGEAFTVTKGTAATDVTVSGNYFLEY